MTDRPTPVREPLDAQRIVDVGIALADADGVSSVTMRRLADELGYKVMALYRHVANKDELLGLMVDGVAGAITIPGPDTEPMQGIREHAIATRDVFVRHPWAPTLWLRFLPGPHRRDHMEYLLAAFDRSGLPDDLAHHGFHAVTNHVIGYTLQAQEMDAGAGDEPLEDMARTYMESLDPVGHRHSIVHIEQHLAGDTGSSFELVLDLILDGLVRLADRSAD
ncbi:MAG: TetR/AcrR family transcriptional regulator [Actinomycetota bacterium]